MKDVKTLAQDASPKYLLRIRDPLQLTQEDDSYHVLWVFKAEVGNGHHWSFSPQRKFAWCSISSQKLCK